MKKIVEWIYLALVRLLQRALLKAVIESLYPHKMRGISYTAERVFVASHEGAMLLGVCLLFPLFTIWPVQSNQTFTIWPVQSNQTFTIWPVQSNQNLLYGQYRVTKHLLYGQYRVTKHFSVINMFSSARSTKKTAREHKHTFPPRELA